MKHLGYLCLLWLLFGCDPTMTDLSDREKWDGYKPVYMTPAEARDIRLLSARDLEKPGKIYVKDQYIFINEQSKGVHVIDNSNPSAPRSVAFINIPGNVDISIKGTILYADNFTDLVAIDISNLQNIRVTKRVENVYEQLNYPDMTRVRFECADASKGVVVGWVKTESKNLKCYR